jgi:hypothetical protein
MRESKQALQAYQDYLGMGSDRSLSALLARYQEVPDPPTRSSLISGPQPFFEG